jgi:metal-sulfur cluster biosynthetic enzyme
MPTKDQVTNVLKEIIDPHTGMSIYEMGLISNISVSDGCVGLTFRPTSSFCPLGIHFAMNIRRRLAALDGVKKVDLVVVGHIHEEMINREISEA